MPINLRDNYKDKEILEKLYASMSATNKDADRKMRIFEDWLEGDSFTTLSKTYDRTVERMRQIVTKMRYKYDFIKRTTEADPLEICKQNFNVRIHNSLMRAGLNSMTDLTEMTESKFRKIRNLGKVSQETVINRMIELGLHFKPEEEESVNEEPAEETETPKMERMYERYNSRCNICDSAPESTDPHCEDGAWTYECPLHKALSEIINSLIEIIDKIDIIRRDNYDEGGYELMGLHIDFKKSQAIYENQLCDIPLFTIIIPATIIPSQRNLIVVHARHIANKYNFDVKFINSEEIVYPIISRPTNITVDRLSQIDSAFRMDFPVEPYVVK